MVYKNDIYYNIDVIICHWTQYISTMYLCPFDFILCCILFIKCLFIRRIIDVFWFEYKVAKATGVEFKYDTIVITKLPFLSIMPFVITAKTLYLMYFVLSTYIAWIKYEKHESIPA